MTTDSEVSDLLARMLFASAEILADHPNGLRERELWVMIMQQLSGIEQDWDSVTGGGSTAEANFGFYSTDLVKAGWIRKTHGRWYITGIGEVALKRWPTPEAFFQTGRDRYLYWFRYKDGFDLARRLLAAIAEGTWVVADDVALEAGLDKERLVHWLQGERPEGWHRVLATGGHIPLDVHTEERAKWFALLADDAIDISGDRADVSRRVPAADLRQLIIDPAAGGGDISRQAWLVRGSYVQGENLVRTLWLPDGVCSLPASRLRDLPAGAPFDLVRTAVNIDYAHASAQDRARMAAEYHAFLSRMRLDDVLVTNDGGDVFIGVITSSPSFVTSVENRANLQRTVHWHKSDEPLGYGDLPDEFSARVGNPDAEVIDLTDFVDDLAHLLGGPPAVVSDREMRLPEVTSELAKSLLVPEKWLAECVELLRDRPQLIFHGPPGTSKTYLALHLADHLVGGKRENRLLVQFHPAYSYEDFFEGFRPRKTVEGHLAFDLVRGPLRRLAAAALDRPGEPHVLIIDEINRGNLAKIFGELYFLLEYRGRSVSLLYGSDEGKGFQLPRNLIILGTMNTADRSIALVDAAMRRRFWFVELHPDEPPVRDMLGGWLAEEGYSQELAEILAALNRLIDDRDLRIGPAYFMRPEATTEQGLDRIWRTQILPLLQEHHYGDGTDVRQRYSLEALRSGLGTP